MCEAILFIVFLIPAMLGIAEILHSFKMRIMSPKDTARKYLLVFLYNESALDQLRHIICEYFWNGKKCGENIIAVDCGLEKEKSLECYRLAIKNDIIFCKIDEVEKVLNEERGAVL